MKVVNLTPHDVNIVDRDGKVIKTYPRSGQVARLPMRTEAAGQLPDGTPLTKTIMDTSKVDGLPEPSRGTMYIVSLVVQSAFPDRGDLLVPAEAVRDDKGRIVGCLSLGV